MKVSSPVGLNVYVIKGVAPHISLEDIFRGSVPFIVMDVVVIILLVIFPQIVLFLPGRLGY